MSSLPCWGKLSTRLGWTYACFHYPTLCGSHREQPTQCWTLIAMGVSPVTGTRRRMMRGVRGLPQRDHRMELVWSTGKLQEKIMTPLPLIILGVGMPCSGAKSKLTSKLRNYRMMLLSKVSAPQSLCALITCTKLLTIRHQIMTPLYPTEVPVECLGISSSSSPGRPW